MATKNLIPSAEVDRRERLFKLTVLVADRDHRTASLVQRILFSFGFRNMDVTTSGESALALIKSRSYDIIITEWNMEPVNGLELVKAIRTAKDDKRIPRDIPIIMLTGRADKESVSLARDAGISEFVAKPFSAKTISTRIVQIIDNPRSFVESPNYVGPDRRRRGEPPPGMADRRAGRNPEARVQPPSQALQKRLGDYTAADILNEMAIAEAQLEFVKAERDFVDWAREDIARLEKAYAQVKAQPTNEDGHRDLTFAAYDIKSAAGMFGHKLGAEVASLLVDYLNARRTYTADALTVIRKHIDTINVVFKQGIRASDNAIAIDMIKSLRQLIVKLG